MYNLCITWLASIASRMFMSPKRNVLYIFKNVEHWFRKQKEIKILYTIDMAFELFLITIIKKRKKSKGGKHPEEMF